MKGITIQLYERTQTGTDPFGRPIYSEVATNVENVLVAPATDAEAAETLNLTGRRVVYKLGIPKGDEHEWTNRRVGFFGEVFRVIGEPTIGIDALIPLSWNKIARVEVYDGGEISD